SAAHEFPSAANGATHVVAEMIPGVGPVGVDARLAEERHGNLAVRRVGEPAVQRLQHHAQAPPGGLDARAAREPAAPVNTGEALERVEASAESLRLEDGIGH